MLSCYNYLQWLLYREWSTDGIITVVLSESQVQCISSHLTSFAVLLDHRGLLENSVSSDIKSTLAFVCVCVCVCVRACVCVSLGPMLFT